MRKNHVVLAVPLVLAGAVFLASGLPGLVATMIYRSVVPSAVSWDGHDAYVKCDGAIKDATQWPAAPVTACQAMTMCANEATLSDSQHQTLAAQMRDTPGCAP